MPLPIAVATAGSSLGAFTPIPGDALVAAAGAAKTAPGPFTAWTVSGKALRYLVLAWFVQSIG